MQLEIKNPAMYASTKLSFASKALINRLISPDAIETATNGSSLKDLMYAAIMEMPC
jgi:hypothetical protein